MLNYGISCDLSKVSYLPQHVRIISRGTSEGISPLFLLLGVTSGTCALLNILVLSKGVLGCCEKGIGVFNCLAASMGVAQVGLQWGCFAVMLVLPRPLHYRPDKRTIFLV
jgi:hypothetical protein